MDTGVPTGPTKLTRDELYERVWSEPMSILAPKLGLSDVGLKKTCTKLRVPTPPRGYWNKMAAGQRVKRTPLPTLPASVTTAATTVTFRQPPKVAAVDADDATGPVAEQQRYEAQPEHRITVTAQLQDPHPLVAKTVLALRKAKPDEEGHLVERGGSCLALDATMGTIDRALRLYDALIKALESRGYRVQIIPGEHRPATVVHIGSEQVPLAIVEPVHRAAVPPKDPTRWEPKRYTYTPSDRLVLAVQEDYLNVRGRWSDTAKRRLEDLLNDIVVGLVENAEAMRRRREERERQQREREAAEQRRLVEAQRKQREAVRVRALEQEMRRWRKSRAVRDYVTAMREAAVRAGVAENERVVEWLAWAESYADGLDPTSGIMIPHDPAPDPHALHRGSWGEPAEDARPIW